MKSNPEFMFRTRSEHELILCCARTHINSEIKNKIYSLVQKNLDWNYFINIPI